MKSNENFYLYEDIAKKIANQISNGILPPGEKLPSVRKLSKELGVSVSTVVLSYISLENQGLIESKPQSGFYVRNLTWKTLPENDVINKSAVISRYESGTLISDVHEFSKITEMVSLGAGTPADDVLPIKEFKKILIQISKKSLDAGLMFEYPPGNIGLRKEIAKQSINIGCNFNPEDIIVTTGALEGIQLSLKILTKPGDIVLTEAPTYYLLLELLEKLNLKILSVPTHSKYGIDIELLESSLKKHKVATCLLYPTLNNPLGSIVPEESRKHIYSLITKYNVPLMEVNPYGELCYDKKPKAIKSFDNRSNVIYISSFSKVIAPGYRTGWMAPGKYYNELQKLQFLTSLSSPTITQLAIAEFLKKESYNRTIRNLRKTYDERTTFLGNLINQYFPAGTKFTKPQGGYYQWVELPENVNSTILQRQALEENISIAAGEMFSSKKDFNNYIRLSCAFPNWSNEKVEKAMKILGMLIKQGTYVHPI